MKNPPHKTAEIGIRIGLFFLKQKNEDYNATREFLRDLCITNISENDEKISIETARPGLLIGRKGQNIDGLRELFGKKIEIIESFCWADIITPIDWAEELAMEKETEAYNSFNDWLSAEEYRNSDYIEDELDWRE